MNSKDYELFFIYGTLKREHNNHYILEDKKCIFLDTCVTKDKYPMFKLREPFPYLQENKGIGENIVGELYLVSKESIDDLNYFEGVPDLYYNGKIDIITDKEQIEKNVNVYFKSKKVNLDSVKFLNEFKKLNKDEILKQIFG